MGTHPGESSKVKSQLDDSFDKKSNNEFWNFKGWLLVAKTFLFLTEAHQGSERAYGRAPTV